MIIKSLVVLKKYPNHNREVRFNVNESSNLHAGNLSELNLDAIIDIVSELTLLINSSNPDDYYEWGVDLYSVVSQVSTSSCRNDIEGTQYQNVTTSSLLNLMIEIRDFKQQYQNVSNLENIVSQAFTQIKGNPSLYKKWPNADYYETSIGNIIISLNLSIDDLSLSVASLLNQLDTNF